MIITPAAWRSQPWKNGRGTTSEILRIPEADDYVVRLSVAVVTEAGPFSTFPGYTRWTTQLAGGAITLAPIGALRIGALVEIDGDAMLSAELGAAPAELLNVLGRPGVRVGIGAGEARAMFSLDDRLTHVFAEPTRVAGNVLWISY